LRPTPDAWTGGFNFGRLCQYFVGTIGREGISQQESESRLR
jgi:hypothetical protein